jgi:hypothetical protein
MEDAIGNRPAADAVEAVAADHHGAFELVDLATLS